MKKNIRVNVKDVLGDNTYDLQVDFQNADNSLIGSIVDLSDNTVVEGDRYESLKRIIDYYFFPGAYPDIDWEVSVSYI